MRDSAIWYVENGFHIFPCKPRSKLPATKHGYKDATDDREQVEKWWSQNREYNIGIHTSTASGVFVLDIDRKHGGLQTLAALEKEHGTLPETWTVRTGSGGLHLYFKHPGGFIGISAGKIGAGLDIRGDNGYVVAPPSVLQEPSAIYIWQKQQTLAEAPAWLLELIRNPPREEKKKSTGKKIPHGKRHDFMVSEAGKLRRIGYEAPLIARSLEFIFQERCDPEPAPEEGYFDRVARSMEKYDPETSYLRTDMGNASRFADIFKGKAAYCPAWKTWLIWNKQHWARDEALKIQELAKFSVERIKDETDKLYKEVGSKEGGEHYKWYIKSQSSERLGALVKLARSMLAVEPEQFDTNDWLLNVENGTIDLKTGELKPHDPEDWITKLAPVKYNPEAARPLFTRFLNDIFQKKEDLIDFVQKFFGYSLTGDTRERLFVIFQGKGRNGKSTLIELMTDILGDYAEQIPPEALLDSHRSEEGGPNPSIAKLKGIRLACAQESEKNRSLAAAKVKRLTGQDKIATRFLHANEFSFKPKFKLLLSTNPLPRISADDQAAWDRVRRVPFNVRMKTRRDPEGTIEEDRSLPTKLKREYQGILAWCVEGCLKWQVEGLDAPECVLKSTDEYRANEDIIKEFLEACCVFGPEEIVEKATLYEVYKTWCVRSGHKSLSSTNFRLAVEGRGIKEERHNNVRCWSGLSIEEDVKSNF